MRRCTTNVISPLFVFFVTSVMILDVVSSYKTTWHYDKNAVMEQNSDSNEIEMKSSIFISRLLKTSPSVLRSTEELHHGFDELNQFPHATFQEHTSKRNLHILSQTSCGQMTCDSVPGYPEEIIIEVAKSSKLIPESPKAKSVSRMNFHVARSLDHRGSAHYPLQSPERVQDCSKLIQEIVIHPRESVDENDQPKLLVNLPQYNFGPSALECRGPKACIDPTTPEQKVFRCVQDYKLKIVNIFILDTKTIDRQKMQIPNGCKCGLHDV